MKKFMMLLVMSFVILGFGAVALADVYNGPTASAGAGAEANVVFPDPLPETTVNSNGKGYRGLPNQGEYHYPMIVPYVGPTTPSQRFRSIEQILMYDDSFSIGAMQKVLGLEVSEDPAVRGTLIKVYITKEAVPGATLCGFIGHVAKGKESSLDVLFQIALGAHRLGANAIHITAQGVERTFKSLGGGIGAAITSSSLAANENGGTARGGGTGLAWGTSKKIDDPWMNATAILVPVR